MDLPSKPLLVEQPATQPNSVVRWCLSVIFLAFVGLSSGAINIFPSLLHNFESQLHFSESTATFMLTMGTFLMYFTLPAGIFMDKYGATLLLVISAVVECLSFIILPYLSGSKFWFVIFYMLFAIGGSSLFISCLQIVLSRSPSKIKGVSTSIVSASLSMAFGFWFKIYSIGDGDIVSGMKILSWTITGVLAICLPLTIYLYTPFLPEDYGDVERTGNGAVLKDWRLYLLLMTILLTTFSGLIVLSGGAPIWSLFDPLYEQGPADWSLAFSLVNCFFTIALSALLDYLVDKFNSTRIRVFSIFWLVLSIIPIAGSFIFNMSTSHAAMGCFMSSMGITFGFGLTQVPAITSDIFGNDKYGFAFGIIQLGSDVSALSTLSIVLALSKAGVTVLFLFLAGLELIVGSVWFWLSRRMIRDYTDIANNSV